MSSARRSSRSGDDQTDEAPHPTGRSSSINDGNYVVTAEQAGPSSQRASETRAGASINDNNNQQGPLDYDIPTETKKPAVPRGAKREPVNVDEYISDEEEEAESFEGDLPSYKDQARATNNRKVSASSTDQKVEAQTDADPEADDYSVHLAARTVDQILPSFKDQVASDRTTRNIDTVNTNMHTTANGFQHGNESPLDQHAVSSIAFADARILPSSRIADDGGGVWTLPSDLPIQTVPNNTSEEVPTHSDTSSDSTAVNYRRRLCLIVFLLLFIGLLAFAIIFPLSTNNEKTSVVLASPSYAQDVVNYINNITLTGKNLSYPAPVLPSAEEVALQFLIEQDAFVTSAAGETETGSVLDLYSLQLLQRYVLAVIYFSMGGPDWLELWDLTTTVDECTLFGVQCVPKPTNEGGTVDVVAILDFNPDGVTGNNLQGTLPVDVALLEYMQGIDVSLNPGLTGTIPPEYTSTKTNWVELRNWISSRTGLSGPLPTDIGNWIALEQFWIDGCDHTGTLPKSIGSWTALQVFDVSSNQDLSGSIPQEYTEKSWKYLRSWNSSESGLSGSLPYFIGIWVTLKKFDIGSCKHTGTLPASIGAWTALEFFFIDHNTFTGTLPFTIRAWTALKTFKVSDNELTGTIPESIGAWTALKTFEVSYTWLNGTIPESIGAWTNIEQFAVSSNYFMTNGTIPESIGAWTNIEWFNVSFNELSGTIPESTGAWTNIMYFDVDGNTLTGTIPESISAWTEIGWFDASFNDLTGSITESIEAWTNIKHFYMSGNGLTGTIPESVAVWTNIEKFAVGYNNLTGTIPVSIGVWTNIEVFLVGPNKLTGTIPDFVGGWTSISSFSVGFNDLIGTIPESISAWVDIVEFVVSSNALTGTIPESVDAWTNIINFDVGSNKLNDTIPEFVGDWTNILWFNASSNDMIGTIPASVGAWVNILEFDVSSNDLIGTIPASVGAWVDILEFDVSSNALTGTVPGSVGDWTSTVRFRFDVSSNALTGTIPESIGAWTVYMDCGRFYEDYYDYCSFDVSNNALTGTLPESIGVWVGILEFNVSSNVLTGTIPESVGDWIYIQWASFDSNQLVGTMPSGICDVPDLVNLTADCSEMECSCCTQCY